jgi:hypothetical protein
MRFIGGNLLQIISGEVQKSNGLTQIKYLARALAQLIKTTTSHALIYLSQ